MAASRASLACTSKTAKATSLCTAKLPQPGSTLEKSWRQRAEVQSLDRVSAAQKRETVERVERAEERTSGKPRLLLSRAKEEGKK